MKRHQRVETKETSIPKDTTEVTDLKGVHPHEEGWSTIRSTDIRQGERLGSVKPSIPSSTQLKDATKTWIPEKGEATPKSSWNALQYENSSTKYLGQGDSLQDDCLPSAAEQIQETVTRNKIIYNMVAEIQALVNILVRILETTEEAPSKVQGCKVESLTSQLGGSSHASEGLYDTHHSRAASRRSCDHASPEMYNYPFTYRGIGDELLTGTEVQRPCAQYLNQVNRGMGFDQLPMPKESELSCRYRGTRDKQEPGFADHRACGPRRTKIVMGHCPHRSTKGHKHSFRYRETGDEQQSGVDHKPLTHTKVQRKKWAVAAL
ncbi:Gene model 906, (NCBI) [Apodemus speciosus]|uniref:Gene model 906, (NCBI) n=1 Tax=Apodemus speciosus TaxID=105296 RepID=A0ABQ0FG11_APOSI